MGRGENKLEEGRQRAQAILRLLQNGPMSRHQIEDGIGGRRSSVARHLSLLYADKQIHIAGHIPSNKGMPTRVWGMGSKPDKEYVPKERRGYGITAAQRRDQILRALTRSPMSSQELAETIHVVKRTITFHLRTLREPSQRQVFIRRWVLTPCGASSVWVPVYAIGAKPDARRPRKESSAARYARLGKTKEYREAAKRRAKLNSIVKKMRKKPQTIFSALGL